MRIGTGIMRSKNNKLLIIIPSHGVAAVGSKQALDVPMWIP